MKSGLSLSLVLGLAFTVPAAAQDSCPMQTTQHVPANLAYGPSQDCDGFAYRVGELQVSGGGSGGRCPLFVVYTPPHDLVVPSPLRTYVESVGQQPISKVTFVCATRYFLIVPIGTSCVADRQLNVGTVQTLLTKPCPPIRTT